MSETIFKLQPHRTMSLQGFDGYGAAAALWGASDSGDSDDVDQSFRSDADQTRSEATQGSLSVKQ